jgi:hypothetical protein
VMTTMNVQKIHVILKALLPTVLANMNQLSVMITMLVLLILVVL